MKKTVLVLLLIFALAIQAEAKVVSKEVMYSQDGLNFKGYLAYDDEVESAPGIVVVHEWWGHNEYARKRTDKLAQLGYVAFALDMYGDGKLANHPDDAGKFASAVMQNQDIAKSRFEAALATLKNNEYVNKEKVAAIGYCFGGSTVLNMARAGLDLKGVVSFHGSLASSIQAQKGEVKAKVLVLNGADDVMITAEHIKTFEDEMKDAEVSYNIIHYPGTKHSFTNPGSTEIGKKFGLPLEYNQMADEQSWNEMQSFFKDIFM